MKSARPKPASLPVEIQHDTGTPRASNPASRWLPRPPLCATMATAPRVPSGKRFMGAGEKNTAAKPSTKFMKSETVRPHQSQAARSRNGADAVLLAVAVTTNFGKTGSKDHRSLHLAAHAAFDRFADRGRRQCEHGEINVLRHLVDAGENLMALDICRAAANDVNGAPELVIVQKFEDDAACGTRFGRYADNRDAARAHQSRNGGRRCAPPIGRNV